ncbi:unnamed protein product [Aspergillus oryzae]|nr:unnamed protein product [Aspergillus oryzae]
MATMVESEVSTSVTATEQQQTLPKDDIYGKYYPTDPKNLSLEGNFGPMDPERIGYLQPTSKDTPLEIMRERLTAWVPIGDISLEGGGLMYLEGSTDIGQKTEEEFSRNAGNLTDEERVSAFNKNMNDGGFLSRDTVEYGQKTDRKWLIGEYEVGDVIFHNPWMVHASCKNKDPQRRIRLATDLRFVDSTKPYDKVSSFLVEHT